MRENFGQAMLENDRYTLIVDLYSAGPAENLNGWHAVYAQLGSL